MVTLAHIKEQSRLSLGSYGRPRMTEELKELGLDIGHRRVGRYFDAAERHICGENAEAQGHNGQQSQVQHRAQSSGPRLPCPGPNQKWAGDISYIDTQEGWLYLAVILDLHSRRIVGWAVGESHEAGSGNPDIEDGHRLRSPPTDLHPPSDRGSRYCSHDYQKILRQRGFKVLMSGKGNCYE